jgi:hypothetical protein
VTHPFHPLCGQQLQLVERCRSWGEDRVYASDAEGRLYHLPAGWTDAGPVDPFVVIAAGRTPFRFDDLVALTDLVGRVEAQAAERTTTEASCVLSK